MLEPPLGGGAGERCVKSCRPQAGFTTPSSAAAFTHMPAAPADSRFHLSMRITLPLSVSK